MRKPTLVMLFFLTGFTAFLLTLIDAHSQQNDGHTALNQKLQLVKELGLSDFALFTEARYTRHLSLADRHSALQNSPAAFDHFPSGSLYPPPAHLHQ